jgi:hypothetical protein
MRAARQCIMGQPTAGPVRTVKQAGAAKHGRVLRSVERGAIQPVQWNDVYVA